MCDKNKILRLLQAASVEGYVKSLISMIDAFYPNYLPDDMLSFKRL
jgi:hypothetical protein